MDLSNWLTSERARKWKLWGHTKTEWRWQWEALPISWHRKCLKRIMVRKQTSGVLGELFIKWWQEYLLGRAWDSRTLSACLFISRATAATQSCPGWKAAIDTTLLCFKIYYPDAFKEIRLIVLFHPSFSAMRFSVPLWAKTQLHHHHSCLSWALH